VKPRILIVDDDAGTLASLSRAFALEGYTTVTAGSAARALERLQEEPVDAILSDVVMPEMDGLDFLARVKERSPDTPVILMSGQPTLDTAVKATRLGALDFVEKPVGLERLLLTLRNALRLDRLQRENRELQRYWRDELALIGESRQMASLRALVERAAPADVPILILGENGTGKELVARAVHDLSPRRDQPFVKMNCAAVPAELVESELFGHEKGAFSGAVGQRRGRFEQADGGTLFLDEIGELSPSTQAKLLRVLQGREFERLGGNETVRVVAATNKDPEKAIRDGALREDLYYRLNVFSISLPPLRERREDIPLLIRAFLDEFDAKYDKRVKAVDEIVLEILRRHPWPGNVRELRNVIERAVIACAADVIAPAHLPAGLSNFADQGPADLIRLPVGTSLADVEREVILKTLAAVDRNKTRAAEMLGISVKTLYNKLNQYGA